MSAETQLTTSSISGVTRWLKAREAQNRRLVEADVVDVLGRDLYLHRELVGLRPD